MKWGCHSLNISLSQYLKIVDIVGIIAPAMYSKQDFLTDVKENLKTGLIQSLMMFTKL